MATKRYNPKGDIHKQKIFEIIRNNFTTNPKGIHPQDIAKLMKTLNHIEISRQAIHSHLRTLTDENKIMAKKGRYVARDLVDVIVFDSGWAIFERFIEEGSPLLLRDRKFNSNPRVYIPIDIYKNQIDDSKNWNNSFLNLLIE